MPELPEVETTRRGIEPRIKGAVVEQVIIRQAKLRWPIPDTLPHDLPRQCLQRVERRAKYLLLQFDQGTLILHLGMSGSLRVLERGSPPQTHDHFEITFDNNRILRLRDPRRFGAVLWTSAPAANHALLKELGPEPLGPDFDGTHLHLVGSRRRVAVKNLIMNSKVVVGVGNIYASESLFRAGIHPARPANRISPQRYDRLAAEISAVLREAIKAGGTTLRDFQQEDGRPGYFAQALLIYGKTGKACPNCGKPIKNRTIGQRSSYYCAHCQR
ncbi:MAG: bifunctional DNA-formamidopyrimidine glycosylase/DNA-(apurinic or apyrimidinic site) lyase [gamma proteobacterium endosymbiont of Lamellibrachia anaximandri]|nr:bifunctional DNA-formamidopyrimidine glycosylase/DNA-(apurinic or apyrimidinic site) lyase [gamma proteobacterium endosymbiont of Lamellibrachia anaximandri]MBL3616883.1 bifunctional DNA-formamidopyrimidine glycosylase/DNA-(apurinic or apyrimidinic site) lyase [gamma proteobacterium endosymbiont of Lamellibrachia anaximandri]